MSDTTTNDWGTDSGLISNYEGKVVDSYFTTDPKVNNGATLILVMLNEVLSVDDPDADLPEDGIEERFACGPDWESFDEGVTAQHPRGKKKFNENSQYGQLIVKLMANPDMEEALKLLQSRGTPRDAAVWLGMKFRWEVTEKPYSFTGRDGKQVEGVSRHNYPVRYLGVEDVEGASQGGGSVPAHHEEPAQSQRTELTTTDPTPQAASPGPSPTPESDGAGGDGDDVLSTLSADDRAVLETFAKEASSHSEFMDKVIDGLPSVMGNAKLLLALGDADAIYNRIK